MSRSACAARRGSRARARSDSGSGNGSDRHPKRYRVAGRRTATILVGITPTAKRKIEGTKTLATVTVTERGPDGERSLERRLPIRL